MKKFLLFLILVGGLGGAGYYFYDPHLKPYLEPIVEELSGTVDELIGDADDKIVKDSTEKKEPVQEKPAPKSTPAKPEATKSVPAKKPEPTKSEIDRMVEKQYPMPKILPLMEIVDHWRNVPRNAYPKSVVLKDKIAFTVMIKGNRAATVAVPGTEVQPVQLNGNTLKVASFANKGMFNTIDIDKTDFKQKVMARYNNFVALRTREVQEKRARARATLQQNAEKFAAIQAMEGKWGDANDPRFAPVRQSIAAGDVRNISIEDAVSFSWLGSEKVGGEMAGTYDAVLVHFETKTIYGVFPNDYKCLLQNGKVVGWIDPINDEKLES